MLTLAIAGLLQTAVADPGRKERHFPDALPLPRCRFEQPARLATSMARLPEQVRAEIERFFAAGGGIADVDGEYNSTDYVDDSRVPRRRFIRAYFVQNVWLVWWEAGGFVRRAGTLALTARPGSHDRPVTFAASPGSMFTGDLCIGSKAFLMGARAM
jgi:hypothetical protein